MRPTLANIGSYEHPNLRSFVPDDPARVATHLFIDVGRKGHKGTTQFTVFLATPAGLANLSPGDEAVIKHGRMLVVQAYDYDVVWAWVDAQLQQCEAATWPEVVERLRRRLDWEHDYERSP